MSNVLDVEMNIKEDPQVVRTWKSRYNSGTILTSIPHELVKKYGIKERMNLVVTDTGQGILYKKLEVQK
jgi:hypothetical protein